MLARVSLSLIVLGTKTLWLMSQKIKFSLILFLFSTLLCLLAGEILVRTFKAPLYPKDSELGWIFPHKELKGSGHLKILVIGDSFTQARGLSEGKAYYDYLLPLASDLKVYGIGAYGSYQEYLLLKRVLSSFSADIVLWQFCPNDFINNVPELERMFHSSLHVIDRPFLMGDESSKFGYEIFPDLKMIRSLNSSRLFLYLYQTWQVTHLPKLTMKPEDAIKSSSSLETTEKIFKKITESLPPKSRFYMFTTETSLPLVSEFNRLTKKTNISVIPVAEKLLSEKEKGQSLLGADQYHWNELGHRFVGDEILRVVSRCSTCIEGK